MSEGEIIPKELKNVHKIILDTAKNLNDLPDIEGAGKKKPSTGVNPLIKPRTKKKLQKGKQNLS